MSVSCLLHTPSSDSARCAKPRGFALIVALLLISFFLLIVVGLTTVVRVEAQSNDANTASVMAQQNAILAMRLALGELQVAAGPDQRTTATGDLLETTVDANSNLTAVWDATNPSAAPTHWLVSQADPTNAPFDPTADPAADWPTLVSARTPLSGMVERAVQAEPVSVTDRSGQTGQVAWWIGDEGVKARFNLTEPEPVYNSTDVERLRVAGRSGIESLAAFGADFTYNDEDFRLGLARISQRDQISLLTNSFTSTATGEFHDVSAFSRSLLTDQRNGGLKQDLSKVLAAIEANESSAPTGPLIDGTDFDTDLYQFA